MANQSAEADVAGEGRDTAEPSAAERRMHLVAYDVWASHFDNGTFPNPQVLLRAGMADFGQHAVMLHLSDDLETADLKYVGRRLLKECGLEEIPDSVQAVPSRSILSRLTDHYLQTVANRAPVGFEAEFVNDADKLLLYRGILLPCSTNGDDIDSAVGVINWKEGVSADANATSAHDESPLQTKKKKKNIDGAEPKAGRLKPQEDAAPVAHQENEMPKKSTVSERKNTMTYETKLNECLEIDGAQAVALVDQASGMALATAGSAKGLNLEVAAAGNTNVMRAKYDTMRELGLKEDIEDVLITLDSQYHLIRPVTSESGKGLFVYLVLDKSKANLAMARFKLSKIEKELTV